MPTTNFIENEYFIPRPHLQVFYCSFFLDRFNDNLFLLSNIKKPASIERSVFKRRAEFFSGRYCAKELLKSNLMESEVAIGENGIPVWPDGIVGSISHCKNNAVAAVAKNNNYRYLGIDIEKVIDQSTIDSISYQIICDEEKELINKHEEKYAYLFTLFFSLKESFFKAVYPTLGFYFDFDAVSVIDVDPINNVIMFNINYALSDEFCEGKILKGEFVHIDNDTVLTLFTLQ